MSDKLNNKQDPEIPEPMYEQPSHPKQEREDQTAWINDELPDLRPLENQLKNKNLAKFGHIVSYCSEYWGGNKALIFVVAFIAALVYLATNENLYQSFRERIQGIDHALWAGDIKSFFGLAWPLLLVFTLLGGIFWGVLKCSKNNNEKVWAWGLSLLILVLSTASVKLGVEIIEWSGDFWEAVKQKDQVAYGSGILLFTKLAFASIIVGTYRLFFSQMLQIRFRTWLTDKYVHHYLKNHRHLHIRFMKGVDNPDQRIAQDLDKISNFAVNLFFGFYLAVLSVYEYSITMIKVSTPMPVSIFGQTFVVPYFMFIAVVFYALLGSILIHFIGRRLVKINFLTESLNADLRFHLINARTHAEGIAFLQGEQHFIRATRHFYTMVRANWMNMMWKIKALGFSQSIYAQAAVIFPVMVVVPRYFRGEIEFGVIMKVLHAFGELRESLSWFIENYDTLAEFRASSTRVFRFDDNMKLSDQQVASRELIVQRNNVGGIIMDDVQLMRPQQEHGSPLVEQVQRFTWEVKKGERWIITGRSGSGKSTILRALADIWQHGSGRVEVPQKSLVLFLPQTPYIPQGSLRDVLAYPQPSEAYQDDAYREVLQLANLPNLVNRLDEAGDWEWLLSGGEKQRISFARMYLNKPEYLILDEATSALDEENENMMYRNMLQRLPQLTLISVSHHSSLKAFHQKHADLVWDEAKSSYRIQTTDLASS